MILPVAIISDHAGFALKEVVKQHLLALGRAVDDLGPDSTDSVDYPLMGQKLAHALQPDQKGIAICGSGIGISIALNRFASVRAALCHDHLSAHLARQHNDANVLCLGARLLGEATALNCVDTFLTTGFEGGRHQRRVDQLTTLT
jgi:ribose 5-phosphate isomerase B